jgi:hypothetical protein
MLRAKKYLLNILNMEWHYWWTILAFQSISSLLFAHCKKTMFISEFKMEMVSKTCIGQVIILKTIRIMSQFHLKMSHKWQLWKLLQLNNVGKWKLCIFLNYYRSKLWDFFPCCHFNLTLSVWLRISYLNRKIFKVLSWH